MRDEASHHLVGCRAFIFVKRVQISELEMRPAQHRARGFAKADPARGARLRETFGEDLPFMVGD